MRSFLSIVKLQLRNMFRRNKERRGKAKFILALIGLTLLYAFVMSFFVLMVAIIAQSFVIFELESEFVALILMIGLMIVLVFCIVTVLTCLYFSRDTEFFLSLPVKPSTVFAAKLTVVYLLELIGTALILLPCLITAGVCMHMGAAFYVILPLAVLITPAIPLFFASVIAIPIMYIASFMRNRGAIGSIMVMLLFGAFFIAYYVGISKMQSIDPETVDLSGIKHIFVRIASVIYPLYAVARAMTFSPTYGLGAAASVGVNLLIGLSSIVAIGAIAMLISSAVYSRGAASQLEGSKRKAVSNADFHSSGKLKALMKKEWREILRTPSFALNCLLTVILCPIIVGFLGYTSTASSTLNEAGGVISQEEIDFANMISRYIMFGFVMFMSVAGNSGPCTSFSREGEKIFYCKSMPVDSATQIKAKSYVYMIICFIASLLGAIVSAFMNFDPVFFICEVLFLIVFDYAAVHFGMLLDLKNPKLKWVTPNEAMKHNRNVIITMLAVMFLSVVYTVAGAVIYFALFDRTSAALAAVVSWLAMFVGAFVFAALSTAFLYKDCDEKFAGLEV